MNNGLIEALREKEKALHERIAKAKAEKQKREAEFRKRLAEIIGVALIMAAPPELKSAIVQFLAVVSLDDRQKRVLREGGWL